MYNCILWEWEDEARAQNYGSPNLNNCYIGISIYDSPYTDAKGNIFSADIPFDPIRADYHLASNSACIDQGSNVGIGADETDIDGEARKVGASVDIGADEYVAAENPAETPTGGQLKNSHSTIKIKNGTIRLK